MSLSFNLSLPTVRESSASRCTKPEDVARELSELRYAAQECFVVITLDTKNNVINKHLITVGILNSCLVHPREVLRPVILDGAAAFIVAHNHPSGDPSPSSEDMLVTRQLVDAGKLMQINCVDHVILGRPKAEGAGYISLRESGMVKF